MADDWPEISLGEVAKVRRGLSYAGKQLAPPGRPFVTLKCFERGGGFRPAGLKTFSGAVPVEFQLRGGELLIANTDLTRDAVVVGAPALAPDFENRPAAFSMDVSQLVTPASAVDNRFLAARLSSRDARNFMQARAAGSTVLHLHVREVPDFRFRLPPLVEQRRIAEVLDTLDEAIQKTEQVIAKLKQMKQGLLHDLLTRGIDENGELRDPEQHPEQFMDSPLGRIPAAWEVRPLGTISRGGPVNGVFKEPHRAGRGLPLLNVGDLYSEFGVDLLAVERFDASAIERARFAIEAGDIFFTRSSLNLSGIAQCNIAREVPEDSVFECHVMRLQIDDRVADAAYVALWCRAPFARSFFMARAKQVTMTTISQPDLVPLPTPCPPLEEQQRVVAALDGVDVRLASEVETHSKLRALKVGLGEDLITGRVRASSSTTEAA